MLEVGSVVGGRLRIERILGQGGMGIVAVATHLELGQQVALKVVHDAIAENAEVVERFIREGRASAKLRSEHVCKVTDVGRLDSGAPYLVMELLDGYDLGVVVEQGTLPEVVAADYVLQACVAIAEAHAIGIVHRDLKPKNLFVTRRLDDSPLIKVLDFGIAKAPTAEDTQLTKTTTVIGSPGYMSPEQLRSAKEVDARSDIWSLGVILYECVAGKLPFPAETLMELAVQIAMDPPRPLPATLDPRFTAIVMRCLEKPPDKRYQDVAAFAADLAEIVGARAYPMRDLVAKLLAGKTGSMSMPASSLAAASSKPPTVRSSAGVAPTAYDTGGAPGANVATAPPPPPRPPVATASAAAHMPVVTDTAMVEPPKKSRRGLVIALVGIVLVAGAAVVAVTQLGGKHDPKQPPAHKDAAVASVADATIAPDAAIVANVEIDAAVAVDAAVHFDAGAVHADAGAVRADAAVVHADAAVHPDAAVIAHVDAAVPHPDAAPEDRKEEIEAARAALAAGDDRSALSIAEKILKTRPKDTEAHRIAARAACDLGDADAAKAHFGHVSGNRVAIVRACRKHHIDLEPNE